MSETNLTQQTLKGLMDTEPTPELDITQEIETYIQCGACGSNGARVIEETWTDGQKYTTYECRACGIFGGIPEPEKEPGPAFTTSIKPEHIESVKEFNRDINKTKPEIFTQGQKVKSVAGEIFEVIEVFDNSMTVKDMDNIEYDGLFETFSIVEGGIQ